MKQSKNYCDISWSDLDSSHVDDIVSIIAYSIKRNVVSKSTGQKEIAWLKSFQRSVSSLKNDEKTIKI